MIGKLIIPTPTNDTEALVIEHSLISEEMAKEIVLICFNESGYLLKENKKMLAEKKVSISRGILVEDISAKEKLKRKYFYAFFVNKNSDNTMLAFIYIDAFNYLLQYVKIKSDDIISTKALFDSEIGVPRPYSNWYYQIQINNSDTYYISPFIYGDVNNKIPNSSNIPFNYREKHRVYKKEKDLTRSGEGKHKFIGND